ncbi:hypothetical protein MFRU_001g03430 [Monilinia fructicola]|uniref:Uncharacterized protein n=1 Tax=Monilinia fructicola TaxID=38448 RepID=A0A5M9K4F7_MONFR|nr:hypothetical protein EYC84_005284 [Monilinia fructicola]KAG4035574.1 hypothetical protein MFRU_001g03430 [Monilinia fructicola]
MKEQTSIQSKNIPVKRVGSRKRNDAASVSGAIRDTEQSEAEDEGAPVNTDHNSLIIPIDGDRRSGRSKWAAFSYQEQYDSEEEEERTTKRKKKGATHNDEDTASEPSAMRPQELAKPKIKSVNASSPQKAATPKAKAVRLRT